MVEECKPLETGITQRASTGEFNIGTTRATRHIPGYSGFIASQQSNPTAAAASAGQLSRPSDKDTMLLSVRWCRLTLSAPR
jgi:hypothetical protein